MPGPELRVTEGDTVQVTLDNQLPVPTTIHWHGINVPNATLGRASNDAHGGARLRTEARQGGAEAGRAACDEHFPPREHPIAHGGHPSAIQARSTSICSAGHDTSHGIVPSTMRSRMLAACCFTSS